jgi:hypothetical protein
MRAARPGLVAAVFAALVVAAMAQGGPPKEKPQLADIPLIQCQVLGSMQSLFERLCSVFLLGHLLPMDSSLPFVSEALCLAGLPASSR